MQKGSLVDRLKSRPRLYRGVIVPMLAIPLAVVTPFISVWRSLVDIGRDPQTRSILRASLLLLLSGMLLFHWVEDFRWLDALYFSFITVATIGFGDFAPETDAGKILTIVYSIFGLGILAAFISTIATKRLDRFQQRSGRSGERPDGDREARAG